MVPMTAFSCSDRVNKQIKGKKLTLISDEHYEGSKTEKCDGDFLGW